MAFDFPASPVLGQKYLPPGGPSYAWDGVAWRVGMIGGGTAEARNRIVNPAMQISQQHVNTAVGSNSYGADQWIHTNGTTASVSSQRVQVTTPNGSANRLRLTATTADAALTANEYYYLNQNLEGARLADFLWGSAAARQVVVRFGFNGPEGTYSLALRNSAASRSYVANFSISPGQANNDTEQVFVIPGDTVGPWTTDTGKGMMFSIILAGGTTYQGVAGWQNGNINVTASNTNGVATAGNAFEVFDVGLYLDPLNSGAPPLWELQDDVSELAICRRYYGKYSAYHFAGYTAAGASHSCYSSFQFQTQMRAVPAVTFSGPTNANTAAGMALNSANVDGCALTVVSTAAGTFYSRVDLIADARIP